MSPRVKCLALLALLAVSFAAVSSAARPDPASSGGAASTAQSQPQVGEDCGGGGVGAEECLMRRTLEAHLDYIYTQNHHH
ncbi:phytosulfokines 4-like isoform X2 [Rhodamnia argentea]|uniref:Phytosulfokine n=1 Tax=Rhodamnia argentea TaxID=178133 RepID=A0ABM3HE36_9MYRT|nr:phytosulfokines 4-like isoform X2 [Rhodamnia argentea]